MKKRWCLLVILLFLVPIVNSQEPFELDSIALEVDINSIFEIEAIESNYKVPKLVANLTLWPIESEHQTIESELATPPAAISDNSILYTYSDLPPGIFSFSYVTKINSNRFQPYITKKVQFPINKVLGMDEFLNPTKIIDSDDPAVKALASELAEGEDDLFIVASKIADWTRGNIEYNLSTLTADASQSASWVLRNRQGVCDELTTLFIAMMRSVGVPARFVSGIAYTNSPLFPDNWGLHGWAEVYFPETGWVPFDVTYGQYGFVDASHIIFKRSFDSRTFATRYQWTQNGAKVTPSELSVDVSVIANGHKHEATIALNLEPIKTNVGFGSYNIIKIDVTNLINSYQAFRLIVADTEQLTLTSPRDMFVILKPQESTTVYATFKVNENLNPKLIYTFPIAVYGEAVDSLTEFRSKKGFPEYSKSFIDDFLNNQIAVEDKTYSSSLNMNCTSSKSQMYVGSTSSVVCSLKNQGNTLLDDLKVCLNYDCHNTVLYISEEGDEQFTYKATEIGDKDLLATARNDIVSKSISIPLEVLDLPDLSLKNISYPNVVPFSSSFNISFVLDLESQSRPRNPKIILRTALWEKEWQVGSIAGPQKWSIEIFGKDLRESTDIDIIAKYIDLEGREYSETVTIRVDLEPLTVTERIFVMLNNLQAGILNFLRA